MTGRISSFQSMGAADGPGIRCVVFLQGCPLRCLYCHNPETWDTEGGYEISADDLIRKIERFGSYIKFGGVTVSGGEPLLQGRFTAVLFEKLREKGYHTALDTSGVGNIEAAAVVLKSTDLVICDLKFDSDAEYKKYCGAEIQRVYDFLDLTCDMRVPLWVRRVIIPGINDRSENVLKLKETVSRYPNLRKVELLPFRKLCTGKYESLGIDFKWAGLPECGEESIAQLRELLSET